jgi:hypothetical protein
MLLTSTLSGLPIVWPGLFKDGQAKRSLSMDIIHSGIVPLGIGLPDTKLGILALGAVCVHGIRVDKRSLALVHQRHDQVERCVRRGSLRISPIRSHAMFGRRPTVLTRNNIVLAYAECDWLASFGRFAARFQEGRLARSNTCRRNSVGNRSSLVYMHIRASGVTLDHTHLSNKMRSSPSRETL